MKKKSKATLLVFLGLIVAGGAVAGTWYFLNDNTVDEGDLAVFCILQSNTDTEAGESETADELTQRLEQYYLSLEKVAPLEIRPQVRLLAIQQKEIEEVRREGNIEALFSRVYGDEAADLAEDELAKYRSQWC